MDAIIHVYTYKEGLLSKLAHDLRFTLTRFSISARGSEVSGRFEIGSLRVDGVMRSGKLERAELSQSDRDKIHETLKDVLGAREYGEARLSARLITQQPPFVLEGQLTLRGDTRPITLQLEREEARLFGELDPRSRRSGAFAPIARSAARSSCRIVCASPSRPARSGWHKRAS